MKEILITAFEPFGGNKINPTEMILIKEQGHDGMPYMEFDDMYKGIVAAICRSLAVVIP